VRGSAGSPTDVVHYGPDIPTEAQLRLCGNVAGKRVLELGCGDGSCSIAFAKQGARATGVDASAEQLASALSRAEREGVRVELHQGDLAALAFLRADQIDLAFSAGSLGEVEDLDRVFRQVHRVLKEEAPLVFSLPHPAYDMIGEDGEPPLSIRRSYFDRSPIDVVDGEVRATRHHHTVSDLFTSLGRANFRVDTILEPEPLPDGPRSPAWRDAFRYVPRTLVVRARKQGA
jgi:cyclopropane fatty-acyl-phospholipid synthase-like methyltransferase